MRTCVRVRRGHDPACRPRLVLRVGRAARRPEPARQARDRRRRGRSRRELRGEGVRRPHRDGRVEVAAAVPARGRRPAAHGRVLRGEQGRLRGVRRHDPVRRGAVDRRGVPRRARDAAPLGIAGRDGRAAAARRARARRPADHGRGGADEVPRQGRERRREAGRPPRRPAGPRARLPARAPGRAPLGRRPEDGDEAPRARAPHRRRGRGRARGDARLDPRRRRRPAPARARPQPRPAAGRAAEAAPLDGGAARPRAAPLPRGRRGRRVARRARRARHPADAEGRSHRADGDDPAPLRRLLARDARPHAARARRPRPRSCSRPPAGCSAARCGRSTATG